MSVNPAYRYLILRPPPSHPTYFDNVDAAKRRAQAVADVRQLPVEVLDVTTEKVVHTARPAQVAP